jgi:hypothetical protein
MDLVRVIMEQQKMDTELEFLTLVDSLHLTKLKKAFNMLDDIRTEVLILTCRRLIKYAEYVKYTHVVKFENALQFTNQIIGVLQSKVPVIVPELTDLWLTVL